MTRSRDLVVSVDGAMRWLAAACVLAAVAALASSARVVVSFGERAVSDGELELLGRIVPVVHVLARNHGLVGVDVGDMSGDALRDVMDRLRGITGVQMVKVRCTRS